MTFRISILALASLAAFSIDAQAKPPCEFENTGQRRISGNNPKDLDCIRSLAAAGDEFQQYYLGLILIGQVPGPKNVPDGLAVLKEVALLNNKYSADAMRFIGYVYKEAESSLQNYELAYQWLYLASLRSTQPGSTFPLPDEKLSSVISPQRMRELERRAQQLLENRQRQPQE